MPGPPEQRAAGARTKELNGGFLFALGWLFTGVISSGLGESYAVIVGRTGFVPAADLVGRPGMISGLGAGGNGKGSRRELSSTPNKGIDAVKVGAAGVEAANLLSSNYGGTVRKSSE